MLLFPRFAWFWRNNGFRPGFNVPRLVLRNPTQGSTIYGRVRTSFGRRYHPSPVSMVLPSVFSHIPNPTVVLGRYHIYLSEKTRDISKIGVFRRKSVLDLERRNKIKRTKITKNRISCYYRRYFVTFFAGVIFFFFFQST